MRGAAPLVAPVGDEAPGAEASAPVGAAEGASAAKTALMEAAATRTAREIFFMSMVDDRTKTQKQEIVTETSLFYCR